jgi:hypothetical protein
MTDFVVSGVHFGPATAGSRRRAETVVQAPGGHHQVMGFCCPDGPAAGVKWCQDCALLVERAISA